MPTRADPPTPAASLPHWPHDPADARPPAPPAARDPPTTHPEAPARPAAQHHYSAAQHHYSAAQHHYSAAQHHYSVERQRHRAAVPTADRSDLRPHPTANRRRSTHQIAAPHGQTRRQPRRTGQSGPCRPQLWSPDDHAPTRHNYRRRAHPDHRRWDRGEHPRRRPTNCCYGHPSRHHRVRHRTRHPAARFCCPPRGRPDPAHAHSGRVQQRNRRSGRSVPHRRTDQAGRRESLYHSPPGHDHRRPSHSIHPTDGRRRNPTPAAAGPPPERQASHRRTARRSSSYRYLWIHAHRHRTDPSSIRPPTRRHHWTAHRPSSYRYLWIHAHRHRTDPSSGRPNWPRPTAHRPSSHQPSHLHRHVDPTPDHQAHRQTARRTSSRRNLWNHDRHRTDPHSNQQPTQRQWNVRRPNNRRCRPNHGYRPTDPSSNSRQSRLRLPSGRPPNSYPYLRSRAHRRTEPLVDRRRSRSPRGRPHPGNRQRAHRTDRRHRRQRLSARLAGIRRRQPGRVRQRADRPLRGTLRLRADRRTRGRHHGLGASRFRWHSPANHAARRPGDLHRDCRPTPGRPRVRSADPHCRGRIVQRTNPHLDGPARTSENRRRRSCDRRQPSSQWTLNYPHHELLRCDRARRRRHGGRRSSYARRRWSRGGVLTARRVRTGCCCCRDPPFMFASDVMELLARHVDGGHRSDPHRGKNVRRRPTLPRGPPRSTIGAEGLSFRVRDGTGRFPFAITAETLWRCGYYDRTSGTAQWTRTNLWQVLGLLVPVSCMRYRTSTSGLSTRWSTRGPYSTWDGRPHLEASFPLRCFQRLSLPNVANQQCRWHDNWHTRGSSVPVLSY
jgi:hypothetical protein